MSVKSRLASLFRTNDKIRKLEKDLERQCNCLLMCGIAAMENTPTAINIRLMPNHNYYTASYQAVCDLSDSELLHRNNYHNERAILGAVLSILGLKLEAFVGDDNKIDTDMLYRHISIIKISK